MSARIAIIGAGMAGASCAWHLRQSGVDVDVFDKSLEVGGRMAARAAQMHTKTLSSVYSVDYGAQYFTVRDDAFRAFVQSQLGEAGSMACWKPRIHHPQAMPNPPDQAEPWYVGVPSMAAALRPLLAGSNVFTQAHILRLEQDVDGWTLEATEVNHEHTQYSGYAGVVVATPAALAWRLVRSHSQVLARICQQAVLMPCWSLQIVTEALPDAADVYRNRAAVLDWIARDSSKPGRKKGPGLDSWVAHAQGEWSARHLEMAPDEAVATLEAMFITAMGEYGQHVRVLSSEAFRWRYAKVQHAADRAANCDEGLAVCGDYLREGRVEGAYLSGREVAQQLLVTL